MRQFIILTLLLCGTAFPGVAQDHLPDGEGRELVIRMCVGCHALAAVTDARLPKELWISTVDDMMARGAKGTEEEVETVIAYLVEHFPRSGGRSHCADQRTRARADPSALAGR